MSGWKHPTVSPWPILIYMIVCTVIFRTYPHPCDALQLCLRQVCYYDRGGSRSSKDHLVMRCLFCSCVLYEHTLPLLTLKWSITNKWSEEVLTGYWHQNRSTFCQPILEELAVQGPSSPLLRPCGLLSPTPPLRPAETHTGDEGCAPSWMLMWQRQTSDDYRTDMTCMNKICF